MSSTGARPPGVRERTRRLLRADLSRVGIALLLEQGFEATTMDQIAAAAGLSRRSLFRYVATKEDVVLGGLVEEGLALRDALVERPATEGPWEALRAALAVRATRSDYSADRDLRLTQMILATPALRAAHVDKQLQWQRLLVPEVARRLTAAGEEDAEFRARVIVVAVLGCLDAAVQEWAQRDGRADLGQLYDAAVAAMRG